MYSDLPLGEIYALTLGSGITIPRSRAKIEELEELELLETKKITNKVFTLYPLTLGEIGEIGYERYQLLLSTVLVTTDILEITDDLNEEQISKITNYDIVVTNCIHNLMYRRRVEECFTLFTRQPVKFLDNLGFFIVGDLTEDNVVTISRENFDEVIEVLRLQNMLEKPEPKPRETKESKRKRELREKLEKGRSMIAEAKQEKESTSVVDIMITVGTFMEDFAKISNMTLYQLYQSHNSFLKREDYSQRYEAYLAGGDPKKLKLDTHWAMLK